MPELRLEIDPLQLDKEWQDQPKQRQIWGELLADAQLELDEAKSGLGVIRAEIEQEVRDDPAAYDLPKVTENSVASAVTMSKPVQVATARLNKARHKVGVLQAAVDGLEHCKRALTSLVELHGQDYYSVPRMPAGVKDRRGRRQEGDEDDDD